MKILHFIVRIVNDILTAIWMRVKTKTEKAAIRLNCEQLGRINQNELTVNWSSHLFSEESGQPMSWSLEKTLS